MVTIVDYDVVSLYRRVPAKNPDKQLIIYGASVLDSGAKIPLDWSTWLGLFKGYQLGLKKKDKWYDSLRRILVELFKEDTVEYLESMTLQEGMGGWGLTHGKN